MSDWEGHGLLGYRAAYVFVMGRTLVCCGSAIRASDFDRFFCLPGLPLMLSPCAERLQTRSNRLTGLRNLVPCSIAVLVTSPLDRIATDRVSSESSTIFSILFVEVAGGLLRERGQLNTTLANPINALSVILLLAMQASLRLRTVRRAELWRSSSLHNSRRLAGRIDHNLFFSCSCGLLRCWCF